MKRFLLFLGLFLILSACGKVNSGPNKKPNALFKATTSDLTVNLDASDSNDPDGTIKKYAWTFGDGQSGSGVKIDHKYKQAGTFEVTLTVTDNGGLTAKTSKSIQVTESGSSNNNKGTISGNISVSSSSASQTDANTTWLQNDSSSNDNTNWQYHPEAKFVPGEIIVKFKEGNLQTTKLNLSISSNQYSVYYVRTVADDFAKLYKNSSLDQEKTLALVKELDQRNDVEYASPNYIMTTFKTPNDKFYERQWHYPLINLPKAWDITTGSSSTTVAIIDSGIYADVNNASNTHPDFVGKVLPGYDFISDPHRAGDGDGRDSNPFDPIVQGASFHGSHVAGTVAAATNNSIGVAGINWQAKILPVRAIGTEGSGSLIDIIEGSLWAAGLYPSIANSNPADILNLSLGGIGQCNAFLQEALNKIIAAGKIVVVAAGNGNTDASEVTPANCRGVITVGAVDFAGARAPYSNFGSKIDVMAPGGNSRADLNNDSFPDGVLSTFLDPFTKELYGFYQGTSMATPHVTGVISLMKAVKPNLTSAEALKILRSTAKPLSASQCNSSGCGAGLIDAFAAVKAVKNGNLDGGKGTLNFNPSTLNFGSKTQELDLNLNNSGNGDIKYSLLSFTAVKDNPASVPDKTIRLISGARSGRLSKGQDTTLRLGVNRNLLSVAGAYQVNLIFEVDNGQTKEKLKLLMKITKSKDSSSSVPMIVAAFVDKGNNDFKESGYQTASATLDTYQFAALAGKNRVIAWSDKNKSKEVDIGDLIGIYPSVVDVVANQENKSIDVVLKPYTADSDISAQQRLYLKNSLYP